MAPAQSKPSSKHRVARLATSLPEERYLRGTAWGLFAFSGLFAIMPLVPPLLGAQVKPEGMIICASVAAFFAVRGALRFRAARKSHPESVVYTTLGAAPPELQRAWLRRMLPIASLAFAVLSASTAYDLYRLDQQRVESIRVYWPIGPVYERLGFWPAALLLPIIGVCTISALLLRSRRLTRA